MSNRRISLPVTMHLGAASLATLSVLLATGCATRSIPGAGDTRVLTGSVHGGQQPVVGSQVYLFAVHTDGSGTVGSSILANPVTTDATGAFTLNPSSYTCQNPSDQVFFVAAGGDAGSGSNNDGIVLMTTLGNCGNLNASTFLSINEATTVAAAYLLAPILDTAVLNYNPQTTFDPQNVSFTNTSVTNPTDVATAFSTASSLVDPSTGHTTTNLGVTVEQTVNTLADIAAACVNTGSSSSTPCQDLFTAAGNVSGQPVHDTFTALATIAQNAQSFGTGIFSLVPPTPPFQPNLSSAPQDWTLPTLYTSTPWTPHLSPSHGVRAR